MEFEHSPKGDKWGVVKGILSITALAVVCLGLVWLIWDNWLVDGYEEVVEFLNLD